MKALSALRQVFSLKKNEELGRKFSPEELKRIVDAMKEYAASKLQEQRAICQREFELAYDSGESNLGTNPAITELYVLQSLKRVKPLNLIMAKTNSYSRFWTLLAKMPCSDRDGLKLQLVSSFTNGRTDSLREMTLSEYNSMIREMEKQTGSSRPVSYEVLKKKRSAVLHQMQLMGIDTANWAAVDNFCLGVRIAGKKFRELSADDLDAVLLRIRSIRQKDMQKAKKELN